MNLYNFLGRHEGQIHPQIDQNLHYIIFSNIKKKVLLKHRDILLI